MIAIKRKIIKIYKENKVKFENLSTGWESIDKIYNTIIKS